MVKNPPAMQETQVGSLGQEDSLKYLRVRDLPFFKELGQKHSEVKRDKG